MFLWVRSYPIEACTDGCSGPQCARIRPTGLAHSPTVRVQHDDYMR
jgi:hypothetical protein